MNLWLQKTPKKSMNFVEFKILEEMFPLFLSDPHSSYDQNPDEHQPTIFHMLEKNSMHVREQYRSHMVL